MGNLPLSTGLFGTDARISAPVDGATFTTKKIRDGITYYYLPSSVAKDSQTSVALCSESSVLPLVDPKPPSLSDAPLDTSFKSQNTPLDSSTRPLLLFFCWLGARSGGVAKYRDLYLELGMDVLVVRSSASHFLWPRWGLDYGLEVLTVLEEEPALSERPVLVHSSSIGGYTFTQLMIHMAGEGGRHAGLAQRVVGHVYDSLVVGSLEHMAIGLGKTLVPRLEGLVRNAALLYFWLLKSHTADYYDRGIQVFHRCPISAPALFFFSDDDAMCNPAALEQCMALWRKKGMSVESRRWKESVHAGHMRRHPEEYLYTLHTFLNSLGVASIKAQM